MTDHVERFAHEGMTVTIEYDPDPQDPRDWGRLGRMLCAHRRYELGDEQIDTRQYSSWDDVKQMIQGKYEPRVILPLYLLDHSGLTMRTGPFHEDPGGWDSGVVGFIFDDSTTAASLNAREADVTDDEITATLEWEVRIYSAYLEGAVFAWRVETPEGDLIDSCGGYFGWDGLKDAKRDAMEAAEAYAPTYRQEQAEQQTRKRREALTLADAIDAYRSVRVGNHDWMRLSYDERMSPHELDELRKRILKDVSS